MKQTTAGTAVVFDQGAAFASDVETDLATLQAGAGDTDEMEVSQLSWLGQTYLVVPGGSTTARIFRKDGHGCDGKQGVFDSQPTFIIEGKLTTGDVQPLDFDSHGSVEMTPGVSVNYGSQLAQPGDARWTISVLH